MVSDTARGRSKSSLNRRPTTGNYEATATRPHGCRREAGRCSPGGVRRNSRLATRWGPALGKGSTRIPPPNVEKRRSRIGDRGRAERIYRCPGELARVATPCSG